MSDSYTIKMPQLSDTMTEGTLVSWEGLLGALLALLALGGAATRRPQIHATLVPIWTVLYLWQQGIQPGLG